MFEHWAHSPLALVAALVALALVIVLLVAERTDGLQPRARRILTALAITCVVGALVLITIRFVVLRGA